MATKTFSHAVIWEGKLVPANTPITVTEKAPATTSTETEDKPKKRGAK